MKLDKGSWRVIKNTATRIMIINYSIAGLKVLVRDHQTPFIQTRGIIGAKFVSKIS
jgi:hypothetical protein